MGYSRFPSLISAFPNPKTSTILYSLTAFLTVALSFLRWWSEEENPNKTTTTTTTTPLSESSIDQFDKNTNVSLLQLLFWFMKPLPMAILCIQTYLIPRSFLSRSTRQNLLGLSAAQILSLIGDVALMFVARGKQGKQTFLFGVGSFFLAHCVYIIIMVKDIRRFPLSDLMLNMYNQQWIVLKRQRNLVIGFGSLFAYCIWNHVLKPHISRSMTLPICCYLVILWILLITSIIRHTRIMMNSSLNQETQGSALMSYYGFVGSVIFIASDSLLAWEKFVWNSLSSSSVIVGPVEWISLLFYFSGQWLLTQDISSKRHDHTHTCMSFS